MNDPVPTFFDVERKMNVPRKRKGDKIVRIRFSDTLTMMFGTSYKPWEQQVEEYLFMLKRSNRLDSIIEVQVSDNQWIGWGGLKWCSEDSFQEQLNREGCQSDEPDNPAPRRYKEMVFYEDSDITKKITKMVENLKANCY